MIFLHALVDKVLKVFVESNPCSVELPKRVQSVRLKVRIIDEIEGCTDDVNQSRFHWTS